MNDNTNTKLYDLQFARDWTKNLLDIVDAAVDGENKAVNMKEALFQCSSICYKNKGMDDLIGKFRNMDDFFGFLINEWDWKFSYNREKNELLCDENKSECICPVAKACNFNISPSMCYCTEGMLKRIFETALNRTVTTTMVTSVLRGGRSCVYKIVIENLTNSEIDYFLNL